MTASEECADEDVKIEDLNSIGIDGDVACWEKSCRVACSVSQRRCVSRTDSAFPVVRKSAFVVDIFRWLYWQCQSEQ